MIIMAITVSVSVSEAQRMLKIVAKLSVGLAKAVPRSFATNCGRWVLGVASIRFRLYQSHNYCINNITSRQSVSSVAADDKDTI